MNTFTKPSKSLGISAMLLALLWLAAFSAIANPLTNVFSGNVVLDGDISDFFDTNGVPLPGVCVTNDPAGPVPGVPNSAGLGEAPSSAGATLDGLLHPSGFNQRRIMSAYNPSLNGGTIFVGIDLPGGTDSIANPSYADNVVGPGGSGNRGPGILPFDADGNGEPDFIGRLTDGVTPFSACPSPDGTPPNVWSCANESAGALDDPRGRSLGEEEFYNVTVSFGTNQVRAIFIEQNSTSTNFADLILTNTALPFGVRVSSSTGTNGVPLGFDVEFAITNVNVAVTNECDRLNQRITIRSGSNSDGSGQGEDVNSLICLYNLPASIAVTKQCPPTNAVPGTLLVFTGAVTNTGQVTLTNVTVVNNQPTNNTPVLGPITLAPGTAAKFTNSYLVPTNVCSVTDTLIARGHHCAYILPANIVVVTNIVVTNTATATCLISNTALIRVTKTCPPTNAVPGSLLIFSGTVSNAGTITLTNVTVVNDRPTNNTPVFGPVTLLPGQSTNFTGNYLVPLDMNACAIVDTLTASGTDICLASNVLDTARASCLFSNTSLIRVTKLCPSEPVPPGGILIFSGTVSNAGTITLTNVIVVNNQPTNNTPAFGPVTLPPGQSMTFTGIYLVPITNNACTITDTLTATGQDTCLGSNVTHAVTATCLVSNTPLIRVTKTCPPTNAVPGSLLIFSGTVSNAGTVTLTNVSVFNNQPTNNTPVANFPSLNPGQVAGFTGMYTVPTNVCSITDTLTARGTNICTGLPVTATTNATCTVSNTPRLQLTKVCPPTNAVPGSLLVFSGTVTNIGNIAITNIMVVNNQPTNNAPVTPATIARLEPGQGMNFTGSYTVPTNMCSLTDTLSVTNARDVCGTLVSATTNATCLVSNTPRLRLTKQCPTTNAAPGTLLVFIGTVTNIGNIAITNIMVVNNQPTNNAPVTPATIARLEPGQGTNFTGSYTVPNNLCDTTNRFSDTLTASGTDVCGRLVMTNAQATCDIDCPKICVVKQIACLLPGDQCDVFGKITTGFKSDTQDPAFCYSITVSNCGRVALTNVMVMDNQLGNLTTNFFAFPATILNVGQSVTNFFKMSWNTDTTNTVTVKGQSASTGQTVVTNDSAMAFVDVARITCQLIVTSPDDQDGNPLDGHVLLPPDNNPHSVTLVRIICNNGEADLANVTLSGPVFCANPAPFTLAAGACVTNVCTVTLTCTNVPLVITNLVTAQVATATNRCGYDITGTNITVNSSCQALVECTNEPCLRIFKSPDKPTTEAFSHVLYTYTVTNCGGITLSNLVVTDDNGTPDVPGDDFVVGMIGVFPPGAVTNFTHDSILPVTICDEGSTVPSGMIIIQVLTNGNIKASFVQAFDVNDNTYGVNSYGWGGPGGHKFSNLTGSDHVVWEFRNGSGQVVLRFAEDYISDGAATPSGFGTLGFGGDGDSPDVGNAAHVLAFDTSLTENLNKPPFLNNLAQYTVDSPASNDVNAVFWEYRMIYTVVLSNAAFGPSGFGSAAIIDQHNSPGKRKVENPQPCDACVTNIATVIAQAGNITLTNTATARVCTCPGQNVCEPLQACTVPYPFVSANPLTSLEFNENEILRAFTVSVESNCVPGQIRVYYNDEHALVLGVRRVIVKTGGGTTTTDYPITPLPGGCAPAGCSAINPLVGSTILSGDQAGTDVSDRPLFPALFITDITADPNSLAGDWQFGGIAIPPHAVFGTWKGAVRMVDKTKNPPEVEVTPDADPAKNNYNLDGGDPAPAGLVNQGYGAEVRWDVAQLGLIPGHIYRLYFMVHDGDQNKEGGDTGHGCAILNTGGTQTNGDVCISNCVTRSMAFCPEKYSFWKKNLDKWPAAYAPGQTVQSVFAKASLYPNASSKTLLEAVDGKAGSDKVKELLKQAVTALLNAASAQINYPFTEGDVIAAVNMALMNGMDQALKDLTELLKDANEAKNCKPTMIVLSPALAVTKHCPPNPVAPGQLLEFTGSVSNSGQITLTNVIVVNNQPASNTLVLGPLTLAPGQSANFSSSYLVSPNDCRGPYTDTLTARGTDPCGGLVTATATASCPGTQNARLVVSKSCQSATAFGQPITFSGIVSNAGTLTVTNISVTDNQVGLVKMIASLAPGEAMGYNGNYTPNGCGTNFTDTVTASGKDTCSGSNVMANASATCSVPCPPPGLTLMKNPDKSNVSPGGVVTYTYTVKNTGSTPLSNVVVTDDNGTPGIPGDDFIVGTIPSLGIGQMVDLTKTVVLSMTICDEGSSVPSGLIIIQVLTNGNIKATFVQAFDVNDNTYGVNAYGWGGPGGHKFSNLTGSDHVVWEFRNGSGQVVLRFAEDYISDDAATPSGFGTLGFGGDGHPPDVGNAAHVLAFDTSLTENLNKPPFLNNLAQYTEDSPASNDVNSVLWEYRMIYTVVLSSAAFGPSGFGSAAIIDQHNSPGKRRVENPQPCGGCVTNIATATAGNVPLSATATAIVCSTNPPSGMGQCPQKDSFWKKNPGTWPTPYVPGQTVQSVFAKASLYPNASSKTLLEAVDGKAGSDKVKELLKQAVAGLLNASSPQITYPFTANEVIAAVNMALMTGTDQAQKDLTDLLKEANEAKDCKSDKPPGGGENCDTDGKPNVLTLTYDGRSCAEATNSQMAISGKTSCSGDPQDAPVVRVIATDSSSPPTANSTKFFDAQVNLNQTFEVKAANAGDDRFGSNTYLYIYNGNTLVQTIQLHTSCSAPLRRGETFGSLVLVDYRIDP